MSGDWSALIAPRRGAGLRLLVPAWRNFVRNLRRYRVLLAALVLSVMALTAVLGTMLGLQQAVREKASRYFAGDLVVLGFQGSGSSVIPDPAAVEAAVRAVGESEGGAEAQAESAAGDPRANPPRDGFPLRAWSRRSTYYDLRSIELFFAGYYTRQRRMVGVEWSLERPVLRDFDFVAGGVPEDGDEAAILISTATARDLGIAVGDALVVSIRSDRGRVNTQDFRVAGIYSEASFFGYTAYVHRRALNRLREAPPERVNEIGVYLANPGRDEAAAAQSLVAALAAEGLPVFGVMTEREAYRVEASRGRDQLEYGVVTLAAQLAEITDLLGAITIIAGAIMVLFLGIVTVGVSNTWTMVVWERTREIGTLRALGMQRSGTLALFLLEALFLGVAGVILGGGLGLGVLAGVERWIEFEPNAFTTLFLTRGRLAWELPAWGFGGIAALAVAASVFGALRAALRAARVNPVEALRHEK